MKICEKCYHSGDYRVATKSIETSTHEEFDLCESHFDGVISFINTPEKKSDASQKEETGTVKAGRTRKVIGKTKK